MVSDIGFRSIIMKTTKTLMFKAFMLVVTLLFAGSISACSKGGGDSAGAVSGGGSSPPTTVGESGGAQSGGGSGYVSVANTGGQLTINGLSKYNGQWVYAALASVDEDDLVLLAADSVTNSVMTCTKITNGSATLKVWKQTKVNDNSSRLDNYSGSDKGLGGGVMIVNKVTITYAEAESGASLLSSGNTPNWMSGAEIIMNALG